ncbi:MAG: hypothetical protein ACLFU8_01185 [Anaerolineales bacterium]
MNSEQYWEQISILPGDLEYLVNLLLEEEKPRGLEDLARALIVHRHQQMIDLAKESLAEGRIYRPGESYEMGEAVIFPHLGNLRGEVVNLRAGNNPEYEPFTVVTVQTEAGDQRHFATDLPLDHPLDSATYVPAADVAPEEIYEEHAAELAAELRTALQQSRHFVRVGHKWFVRDLLMEVSPVQLNIAEAMLDMVGGGPLTTQALLEELELPEEIPEPLQVFSLEHALERDPRFDEVGPAGQALWYLRRMEPKEVREIPEHLRYVPIPYNRSILNEMMISLEDEVDDEWSESEFEGELEPGDNVTVALLYPHWRSGTLPLTDKLTQLFPTARFTDRVRFTFIDGETENEFPGWVARNARYVYGLEKWYAEYNAAPGSLIDIRQGEEPGTIVVNVRAFRSKRGEWLRTAKVQGDAYSFEVTRYPVYCEFDELTALGVPQPEAVDDLAEELRHVPVETLVEQVFRELAVLSLQRAVHAKTLHSVLNLFRRLPPGPMLAILAAGQQYVSLGDNYWSYRGAE